LGGAGPVGEPERGEEVVALSNRDSGISSFQELELEAGSSALKTGDRKCFVQGEVLDEGEVMAMLAKDFVGVSNCFGGWLEREEERGGPKSSTEYS